MSKMLFIDFEATNIDPNSAEPIEFAGLVCDLDGNILEVDNFLIQLPNEDKITDEITDLTGITNEMLIKAGYSLEKAKSQIELLVEKADYIVAHNGIKYDFAILAKFAGTIDNKVLIDTCLHLDVPSNFSKKLKYLCLEYGVILQDAHRALEDVLALKKLFFKFNFNEVYKRATAKYIDLKALVAYEKRHLAKEKGFVWVERNWVKSIPEYEKDNFTFEKLGFKVEVIS